MTLKDGQWARWPAAKASPASPAGGSVSPICRDNQVKSTVSEEYILYIFSSMTYMTRAGRSWVHWSARTRRAVAAGRPPTETTRLRCVCCSRTRSAAGTISSAVCRCARRVCSLSDAASICSTVRLLSISTDVRTLRSIGGAPGAHTRGHRLPHNICQWCSRRSSPKSLPVHSSMFTAYWISEQVEVITVISH